LPFFKARLFGAKLGDKARSISSVRWREARNPLQAGWGGFRKKPARISQAARQLAIMDVRKVSCPLPDCYKQLCDFLTTPSLLLPYSTQQLVRSLVAESEYM